MEIEIKDNPVFVDDDDDDEVEDDEEIYYDWDEDEEPPYKGSDAFDVYRESRWEFDD